MIPSKRRLIHLADDTQDILNEMCTAPSRGTRFSRSCVRPSVDTEANGFTNSKNEKASTSSSRKSNRPSLPPSLLVSMNGFLLADGDGNFLPPETPELALSMYSELQKCLSFIRPYVDVLQEFRSTKEKHIKPLNDEINEEELLDLKLFLGEQQYKRKRKAVKNMTMSQLRQALLEEGLSRTGTKSALQIRLQKHYRQLEHQASVSAAANPPITSPLAPTETELAVPPSDMSRNISFGRLTALFHDETPLASRCSGIAQDSLSETQNKDSPCGESAAATMEEDEVDWIRGSERSSLGSVGMHSRHSSLSQEDIQPPVKYEENEENVSRKSLVTQLSASGTPSRGTRVSQSSHSNAPSASVEMSLRNSQIHDPDDNERLSSIKSRGKRSREETPLTPRENEEKNLAQNPCPPSPGGLWGTLVNAGTKLLMSVTPLSPKRL